jgi:hypothetical protein
VRAHGEGGPGDSRPNGTASRDVGATPESRARQTRRHGTLLWLLLPYLTLAGVVLGHVWRWRHDAFGWRTFRTPLVEHRLLRLGSPLVHLGVVAVFVGHLVGLLVPTSWTAAVGITNATYHLISVTAGTIAGAFMLAGLVLLVARRILQRSIRRTTTVMDLVWSSTGELRGRSSPVAGTLCLLGLAGLDRPDAVRPHHLVVLVLHDVAVPHELARIRELRADAGDLARQGGHGVLEPGLP